MSEHVGNAAARALLLEHGDGAGGAPYGQPRQPTKGVLREQDVDQVSSAAVDQGFKAMTGVLSKHGVKLKQSSMFGKALSKLRDNLTGQLRNILTKATGQMHERLWRPKTYEVNGLRITAMAVNRDDASQLAEYLEDEFPKADVDTRKGGKIIVKTNSGNRHKVEKAFKELGYRKVSSGPALKMTTERSRRSDRKPKRDPSSPGPVPPGRGSDLDTEEAAEGDMSKADPMMADIDKVLKRWGPKVGFTSQEVGKVSHRMSAVVSELLLKKKR